MAVRAALAQLDEHGDRSPSSTSGCSAGLNLFVDAYGYDYGHRRARAPRALAGAALRAAGRRSRPSSCPAIASRIGLDLSPIDVRDDDAVAWLLACLWPDDLERFDRLTAAIAPRRSRRDELTIVRGDMVDDLADAADSAAGAARSSS